MVASRSGVARSVEEISKISYLDDMYMAFGWYDPWSCWTNDESQGGMKYITSSVLRPERHVYSVASREILYKYALCTWRSGGRILQNFGIPVRCRGARMRRYGGFYYLNAMYTALFFGKY